MKAAFLAVAFLLLLPAAAPARTLDLPTLFEDVLPQVKEQTEVPVLLPQRSDSAARAQPPRSSSPTSAPSAGEDPHYTRKVRLTGGRTGYFKPLTCGASCSPPVIEWVEDDVLYWIQAHAGTKKQEKKRLRQMANSAIRHGAR